jgi:hypothetical protein
MRRRESVWTKDSREGHKRTYAPGAYVDVFEHEDAAWNDNIESYKLHSGPCSSPFTPKRSLVRRLARGAHVSSRHLAAEPFNRPGDLKAAS